MASSDEDEHQSNAGQKFSKDVLAVLDQFYVGGMTGWHCRDIELAIAGTGLSLSQVKVREYITTRFWLPGVGNMLQYATIFQTQSLYTGGGGGGGCHNPPLNKLMICIDSLKITLSKDLHFHL